MNEQPPELKRRIEQILHTRTRTRTHSPARVENPRTRRHRMELIEAAAAPADERTKAAAASASKKPPSRLQKSAPSSLQLEDAAAVGGWGERGGVSASARTPIPLLSPLILSPAPLWEDVDLGRESKEEEQEQEEKVRPPVAGPPPPPPPPAGPQGEGWRHPALPMVAVVEPGSLVKFFQSQCAIVNNAQ